MSKIRVKSISITNYRSFWETQTFIFPGKTYQRPVAITGYNNAGKTNVMNAILYWIGVNFVSENTFEKHDFHDLNLSNLITIKTDIDASNYTIWDEYKKQNVEKSIKGEHWLTTTTEDWEIKSKMAPSFFGANKHYNIFFINFHKIKEEISTKKSSRGNLTSFLGKHIKKLVDTDDKVSELKSVYNSMIKPSTDFMLLDSKLSEFITKIKTNYSQNLRNNACEVEFWLPDYEDIFLQMMFKIWLNWEKENLVPIDHFWDGYISMFVMAVIQAIAETSTDDECLFLFEEPESFLHENHQEYFYKMVLCKLAEKHQVIYTTHSDKMVDIFDTKWLIRIEFDEITKQTICKYNKAKDDFDFDQKSEEIITLESYNSYIKSIEPNLNKILFSKKVILVEWPNDLMVYQHAIERKLIKEFNQEENFAKAYLNFYNIAIIPHHWKSTALLLIKLCKYLWLDYFVINDWDFDYDFVESLSNFWTESDYRNGEPYLSSEPNKKSMITTNWNLLHEAWKEKIHFNISKLEKVIWYNSDDKNSLKIWQHITMPNRTVDSALFPPKLEEFLEFQQNIPTS